MIRDGLGKSVTQQDISTDTISQKLKIVDKNEDILIFYTKQKPNNLLSRGPAEPKYTMLFKEQISFQSGVYRT